MNQRLKEDARYAQELLQTIQRLEAIVREVCERRKDDINRIDPSGSLYAAVRSGFVEVAEANDRLNAVLVALERDAVLNSDSK